jgi:hypothetical protein
MVAREEQPRNASWSIVSTVFGSIMDLRFVQPRNVPSLIPIVALGRVMFWSEVQCWNTWHSMVCTVSGMTTVSRFVQPLNSRLGMVANAPGRATVVSETQLQNAPLPMHANDFPGTPPHFSGRTSVVSDEHPWNAPSPIENSVSGNKMVGREVQPSKDFTPMVNK